MTAAPVVAKMKEMPTDDPLFRQGPRSAPDGRKIHPAYLFEVKKPEESKYPWDLLQARRHHPRPTKLSSRSTRAFCPLLKKS